MKMKWAAILAVAIAGVFAFAGVAAAQTASGTGTSSPPAGASSPSGEASANLPAAPTAQAEAAPEYVRPTEKQKLRTFAFDAFGPYALAGSALAASYQQADGVPPEWGQGWDAYGVRVASNFGIEMVTTTTRYGLAAALREDTAYYPCTCKGFGRRLGHALISTVTALQGEDGHRVISFPSIAAPYAGTMTAALGWYPSRFGPEDGFRMGNYNLALQAAQNVAIEFIYRGPHTLFGRLHVPGLSGKSNR